MYGNSESATVALIISPEALSEEECALIHEVYEVYGQYSAWKLRDLTHSEKPWREAENKREIEITVEALRAFFPALLAG